MAETMKVPGIGDVPKKYVYIGGALTAGIVGYAWWSRGTAAEEVPIEDEWIADSVVDTPGGPAGAPIPVGSTDVDTSTSPDTNAEWVTVGTIRMADIGYENGVEVGLALGRYITRQPLTADQIDIVRTTIGQIGNPPVGVFEIIPITEPTPSALTEPTGVKVVKTGPSTVDLTWNPVAGADGYRVYRSGVSQNVADSFDTKAQIGGLESGTKYTFTVAARHSGSEKTGPRSSPVTATTSRAALTAPKNLRAAEISRTWVELRYSTVPGATGYRAYRSGTGQNVGASRDGKLRVAGLKPNTSYTIQVAAEAGPAQVGPRSSIRVKTKK